MLKTGQMPLFSLFGTADSGFLQKELKMSGVLVYIIKNNNIVGVIMNNRQMNIQGMKLFQKMTSAKDSLTKNVLFSPYSLWGCLAMAASGAKGQTKQEILRLLGGADECFEENICLLQSTLTKLMGDSIQQFRAVYLNDQLKANSTWQTAIQEYFKAVLYQLDFSDPVSVVNQINQHIEEHTRSMLKNILSPEQIFETLGLILLDTLFFQGNWESSFDPQCTEDEPFRCADGAKQLVPMMFQKDSFPYFCDTKRKIHGVILPYKDNDCEMIAIMPFAAKIPLQNVITALSEECLDEWLKSASTDRETEVCLPRMKLQESTDDLVSILNASGIVTAFTPQADFSGIVEEMPIGISQVFQSVKLEVDECGTKAAAVTLMLATLGCPPPQKEKTNVFRADRPFVILIHNKTLDTILFACAIRNPISDAAEAK